MLNSDNMSLEKCPALVLNADYRPLSYYPLSLWSWQDSIKSVFLNRVSIVSYYDRVIRSPSFSMKLPSVIALKSYIKPMSNPNFTRFNVFLRDKFSCQYCGSSKELTFDHLLPRRYKINMISVEIKDPIIKYPPLCITERVAQTQIQNRVKPIPFRTQFFEKIAAKLIPIIGVSHGHSQLGFAIIPLPR